MICPEYLTPALTRTFTRIQQQRMQGVPLLNPALHVACVGFRTWRDRCLGVLITPWFMNLVLLPCEGDAWEGLRIGHKQTEVFPSGAYEFTLGEEPGIGRYLSCSLFSPMFAFDSQAAAVATAEAVMAGLMDEGNRESLDMREKEIERIWRGEAAVDIADDAQAAPTLQQKLETPISRRDLLRGRFLGQGAENGGGNP